jgi:spore germination cell wall hydrolase CwlJ-like protein
MRAALPSLAALVAAHSETATLDEESECLARAVYYESRGEPLSGQLAVAEVIINRARSGRFASTLCGVVRQPSQFSFVRRGAIPQPPQASRDWQIAVAIARIATGRLADGGAPDALFFHARRINPGWRLTRVATVGNHVFYR